MKRLSRSRILWIVIGVVLVSVVAVWLWQAFANSKTSDARNDTPKVSVNKLDEQRAHLLETSDALSRYVTGLTGATVPVKEDYLYLPESIDWDKEVVVSIEFFTLDANIFTSATIEAVDGEQSYVVDLITMPEGCTAAQVSSTRVAFIKQTSRDTSLPVIIRLSPNSATCPR